jgi:hypothetical protein
VRRTSRNLARRFEDAERRVGDLVGRAPDGDRQRALTEAIGILTVLRREDFRGPVEPAYRRPPSGS